jgi:hypothetical protein
MKFSIGKSAFLKELGFVQGVVDRKNTIPILSNLVVEARDGEVRFKATDLDITVATACAANVQEEGSACLPAKKLFEIVRSLPDAEVEVQAGSGDPVRIACGRSRFKMPSTARENFPDTPDYTGEATPLPSETLRTFISRTQFAITNEESRYALNGSKFELSEKGLRMVATDGHRLAMVVPGSGLIRRAAEAEGLDRIFRDAGFEWREPGCSMCVAMNGDAARPGERVASTSNRNFEGRQGPGARTHLMSPAMAAAAAVTGRLTDVRRLGSSGNQ